MPLLRPAMPEDEPAILSLIDESRLTEIVDTPEPT